MVAAALAATAAADTVVADTVGAVATAKRWAAERLCGLSRRELSCRGLSCGGLSCGPYVEPESTEVVLLTVRSATPNIVPSCAWALYYFRAFDVESLHQLEIRVRACFQAGAVATGCTHEVTQVVPVYTRLIPDPRFAAACRAAIIGFGRVPLLGHAQTSPKTRRTIRAGSTHMGKVSQRCQPSIRPSRSTVVFTVNRKPEFAAAWATPSANRAVCDGTPTLAPTRLAIGTDTTQCDRLIGGALRRPSASATAGGVL